MSKASKQQMVSALTAAGVAFLPEATIYDLRPLYEKLIVPGSEESAGKADRSAPKNDAMTQPNQSKEKESTNNDVPLDDVIDATTNQVPLGTNWMMTPPEDQLNNNDDLELLQLNREIEILRKKREIQLLRGQLNIEGVKQFDFTTIESMVHPFSGDDAYDIHKWFADMEEVFEIFACNERDKFISLRRLLSGTAKLFLRTTAAAKTYVMLKSALLAEFGRTRTIVDVLQILKSRIIKPGESVRHYVIVMQEIASHADIPEATLIEYIIDGVNDKSNRIAVLLGARTLQDFKMMLDRYEKMRSKANEQKAAVSMVPPRTTAAPAVKTPAVATQENVIRCFNCSKFGHYQSACPFPIRPPNSCFKCHEVGHFHRDCPKKGRVAAGVNSAVNTDVDNAEGTDAQWRPREQALIERVQSYETRSQFC